MVGNFATCERNGHDMKGHKFFQKLTPSEQESLKLSCISKVKHYYYEGNSINLAVKMASNDLEIGRNVVFQAYRTDEQFTKEVAENRTQLGWKRTAISC